MAEPTLTSLLARLEAATDRLESIVLASAVDASKSTPQPSPKPSTSTNTIPASVENFDQLIQGSVKRFIELSEQLDEPIKEQSKVFSELFQLGRQLIYVASQSKKPDYNSAEFAELLGPTQTALNKILTFKDENRGSPFFNHLSTISEGSSAFGWITMEPAPAPYIEEVKNSAIFYSNRILKEYKDKDPKHVDWAKAFIQVLDDLRDYVKEYHTTGLVWNPQGGDVLDVAAKLQSSTIPHKRSPPPVPPRHDRISPKPDTSVVKKEKPVVKKTPRTELMGKKWVIEYHNQGRIELDQVERDHVVYIFQCNDTTIHIKQKVNAVTIDNCRKTGVVIDSVVSNVEIIRGNALQVQIIDQVPTMVIDSTDSVQIYLSETALGLQLHTSKCSSINLLLPDPENDYVEKPIPEQFVSRIVDGTIVTEPAVHVG